MPFSPSRASVVASLVLGAWAGLFARDALAVGTRTFELDSLEKMSGGDVHGVMVASDGIVRAGWTLGNVPLPAGSGTTVTCAATMPDGSVVVGTGPGSGGKVVRISGDQATVLADTQESAVSALAVTRTGTVYAATTSSKVFKISPAGKADLLASLPDVDSVLALTLGLGDGALFAGTGSDGKVMRIEPDGTSSVYYQTSDPFVVSLALGTDGTLFAGTSGKGIVYRITGPGRATVLYDFHGQDVHALAVGPNRTLYAASNEETNENPAEGDSARKNGGRNPAGPVPTPKAKPGKGSLWRFDFAGRPERLMHHDEFHYVSLAVDDRGTPYVGTGAEGRVYTVDDAHVVAMMADTEQRQVGALAVAGRARFIVGSDPAVFHRIVAVGGADSVWTSKPQDAGLRARFGRLTWQSTGAVEVSTRSGDTQSPDTTWSAWSRPVAQGSPVPSPAARFVQVRARLGDATATLSGVSLAFVTENLRAVLTEVTAKQRGTGRDSKETLPSSGSEPPKHDSVVHVAWKVDNPDSDELRYRVRFRREGAPRWLDATTEQDILTKTELDWDTAALPEGKYRLRVEVTDELANPPGDVMRHALESGVVSIDNTPPVFRALAVQGRRLHAEVADGLGPIVRVEIALDGQLQWWPVTPVDGVYDSADETIDQDISALVPTAGGPHLVAVRAYDAAGNFSVREAQAP